MLWESQRKLQMFPLVSGRHVGVPLRVPRETGNNAYAKFWEGQRVLWHFLYWLISHSLKTLTGCLFITLLQYLNFLTKFMNGKRVRDTCVTWNLSTQAFLSHGWQREVSCKTHCIRRKSLALAHRKSQVFLRLNIMQHKHLVNLDLFIFH